MPKSHTFTQRAFQTRSEATAQAVYSKAVGGVFYVVDLASHGFGETGSAISSLVDGGKQRAWNGVIWIADGSRQIANSGERVV